MPHLLELPAQALRVARTKTHKLIDPLLSPASHLSRWRAIYRRKRSAATFIAVTGSSGKSTTTALIAQFAIRRRSGPRASCHQSPPFSCRGVTENAKRGVLCWRAQFRGPQTLKPLIDFFRPQIGVVTLVRLEHKSKFRTLDAVTEEKGQLIEALPANGLAVLNFDDPRVVSMTRRTKARSVTFGQTGGDYVISNIRSWALGDLALNRSPIRTRHLKSTRA